MDKTKWLLCPVCGSKTRDRIRVLHRKRGHCERRNSL